MPFIKDLFSNCPTKIAFNVSGLDAQAIADDWRWEDFPQKILPEYITKLPRYQMYVRSFVGNEPDVARVISYPKMKKARRRSPPRHTHLPFPYAVGQGPEEGGAGDHQAAQPAELTLLHTR